MYAASQDALIKTIMETGDWAHTSIMYNHYLRCLPREVLVKTLTDDYHHQRVSMGMVATDGLL